MKKNTQQSLRSRGFLRGLALALCATLTLPGFAQDTTNAQTGIEISNRPAQPNSHAEPAEYVSIHVDGGDMRRVLNSFALQANRNIVIGPEVINTNVTIHLNNVQWENALDVILKPYGYGFRQVGDATVVGELTRLKALEAIEPLQSRIYKLKYLDASDVSSIIEGMLSPRGSHNIIKTRGQKGWKDLGQKSRRPSSRQSGASLEMRSRQIDDEQIRSKTLVVTDVPSILNSITETLATIDTQPKQILVEARFMEVNDDFLRDVGAQFGVGYNGNKGSLGANQRMFNNEPSAFNPRSQSLSGAGSSEDPDLFGGPTSMFGSSLLNSLLNAGFSVTNIEQLVELNDFLDGEIPASQAGSILDTGGQFFGMGTLGRINAELYINLLEEDSDTKTLSAPKVLTLDNQEAAIVVGTRYPIIESQISSGNNRDVQSETLEYYESIGIQLNVVPQICTDGYINMIVRPSVTEITGFTGRNSYPIIKTRDTETQILAANDETIVIGGLLEDREVESSFKVPFLGDIPILGRLFRRETKDTATINLLIFLSATIVDENNYDIIIKTEDEAVEEESMVIEVTAETPDVIEEEPIAKALPSADAAPDSIPTEEMDAIRETMAELQ